MGDTGGIVCVLFCLKGEDLITARKRLTAALLLCAVGIGIAGLQCGLETRYYHITSTKIPVGKQLRLAMLSDLHSYQYGTDQQPIINRLQQAQPDLILLCGDIVDDKQPWTGAERLLEQITALAPCYYVSGNHEYWYHDPEAIFNRIRSFGVTVLENEHRALIINQIPCTICGVEDPASYGDRLSRSYGNAETYHDALAQFDDLPQDTVNILLAHRPEYMESYAVHPFDLALCGHAHGGQWRIPVLLNGLIAPNQGFFPQYAGGAYQIGNMTGIVGRGLIRDWKPRFFNPPEIVVVDITSQ